MKLFVGSLKWECTDQDLSNHFAQAGEVVEARVLKDRDTGRSRGFGFVTMKDEFSAKEAIRMLSGSQLMGRPIVVAEAKDRSR